MRPSVLALITICGTACLAASSWAQTGGPPAPPAAPEKGMCYELYKPVCGTKDGKRNTYSNDCFAKRDGASEIADGPCGPADK